MIFFFYVSRIFHELLKEKGPMLKADLIKHLQELKLCKEPDYFMPEEPGNIKKYQCCYNVHIMMLLYRAYIKLKVNYKKY
jgi:hypothetical protein